MYYGYFRDWNDVLNQFSVSDEERKIYADAVPVYATYDCEQYEGYATVIFIQHGKFFEVHGSHCSCMGLEDQFEPEETTYEVLKHMSDNGNYSYSSDKNFSAMLDFINNTGLGTDVKQLQFLLTLHFK